MVYLTAEIIALARQVASFTQKLLRYQEVTREDVAAGKFVGSVALSLLQA